MADDFSELMRLAADLERGPDSLSGFVRKAVQVTSNHVKKDAQSSVRGRKGLGHAAAAITYDTSESSDGVEAEIGYDKGRGAGALGNLIEFGAPNAGNQLSPSHDLGNALLNNEGDFVRGLDRAVADSLRGSGL